MKRRTYIRLTAEFWLDVRQRLVEHHNRTLDEADLGVGRYRLEAERIGFVEMVYNGGVERTAAGINNCLTRGWPKLP